MKPTSAEYRESMNRSIRNPSYVRIAVEASDPDLARDSKWTSDGEAAFSNVADLSYPIEYDRPIATLELNRWTLDGGFRIDPVGAQPEGFASAALSDADGNGVATLNDVIGGSHKSTQMRVTFDSRTEQWPAELEVQVNDLPFETYRPESDTLVVPLPDVPLTALHLRIRDSLPYHRQRVEQVLFGSEVVYGNDEIISVKQVTDVDPLSRRLPTETLDFTVMDFAHDHDPANPTGKFRVMWDRMPVRVSFGYMLDNGSLEWLPPNQYVLSGKPVYDNDRVRYHSISRLGSLRETFYFGGGQRDVTLYNALASVLTYAELPPSSTGKLGYALDVSLRDLTAGMPIPQVAYKDAVQMVAHAGCCRVYTNDDGQIVVEDFRAKDLIPAPDAPYLTKDSIIEGSLKETKSPSLKQITCRWRTLQEGDSQEEIWKGDCDDDELIAVYDGIATVSQDGVTVTGGKIVRSFQYARCAALTLSGTGIKTVTIKGYPAKVRERVMTSKKYDPRGEVDAIDNEVIGDAHVARQRINRAFEYLSLRDTYEFDYRGNPEIQPGDLIWIQTDYAEKVPVMVLRNEIGFDGSLSGHMIAKGVKA